MARLFTSGFAGALATAHSSEWSTVAGTPVRETATYVRTGERSSLKVSSLSSGSQQGVASYFISGGVSGNTYFVRFYLRVVSAPSVESRIAFGGSARLSNPLCFAFALSSSKELLCYSVESTGSPVTLRYTSSALGSAWYRIEVSWRQDVSNPTTASYLEFKIDGSSVYSSSSLNLALARSLALGGNLSSESNTSGEWYFSGIAVNDDTGSYQTTWPGEGAVTYMSPDGAGTYDDVGGGTGYQAVDELVPDYSTTQLTFDSNATNWGNPDRLLMTMEAASVASIGASDTITLVAPGWIGIAVTANTSGGYGGIKTGGTIYDITTQRRTLSATVWSLFVNDDATNPGNRYEYAYINPNTSAVWTPSELDAIEAGFRSSDASPNYIMTAFWVLVEHIVAAAPSGRIFKLAGSGGGLAGPSRGLVGAHVPR